MTATAKMPMSSTEARARLVEIQAAWDKANAATKAAAKAYELAQGLPTDAPGADLLRVLAGREWDRAHEEFNKIHSKLMKTSRALARAERSGC